MGYIKLICFCIWAIQSIQNIKDKLVTDKKSGKILSIFTTAFIILQIGSGVALSVYGTLIQSLHSTLKFSLPAVWWIGIIPIVTAIVGLVFVYQRRRQRIVIWILVNFTLFLGNGIIMAYTDVLTPSMFGVDADHLHYCQDPSSWTTVPPSTTKSADHYVNPYEYSDSENDDVSTPVPHKLTCPQVLYINTLLDGLTYSLFANIGVVVMTTVFASVIGCCLQECVEDHRSNGPSFVPVDQVMSGRSDGNGQVFSSIGSPVGYIQPNPSNQQQYWHGGEAYHVESDRAMLV